MFIYQLGWHWEHPATLAIERPNGHFGTQVLLVQSRGRLVMGEQAYRVERNTVFLIQSCVPHCIYADGVPYCDDWIRFSIEQEDNAFIESLGLPFHVPIKLTDDGVSELIKACETVFRSEANGKQETLHALLTAILLHIKGQYAPDKDARPGYYDAALDRIRRDIFADPAREWSLPEIAAELSLSESHFRRLYKQRFGVACTKDIWASRMEYAKQLLLETELTAGEIALRCGYQSYEHFSRSFVRYACVSPNKYRAEHRA